LLLNHLPLTHRFDMVLTRIRQGRITQDMDEPNVPLTSCPHCAAQMPETAAFCPGCGQSMLGQSMVSQSTVTETRAQGTVGAFPESIAGALAYLSFIPAIIFLVLDPYNKNRFVRFHSVQCLLLWGATIALAIAIKLASVVLFIIPVLGPLLVLLVSTVVGLAAVVIWFVLVIKAFQGQMFKLPMLGDLAEQYAGSV
jgi:uncharacterized membrane protein